MNTQISDLTSHETNSAANNDFVNEGLQNITEGVSAVVGEEFFRRLVKSLASVLQVRYAFVAELFEGDTKARTLAYWGDDQFLDDVEFDLPGTPCEEVARGQFTHYPENVSKLFPEDKPLAEMGIESYLGVPLFDENGDLLGHLAVFHTEAYAIDANIVSKLQHFCARASVELTRQRIESQLSTSEARLSNILRSAMDAIITINQDRRITLLNPAAEEMFLCDARKMIGQRVDALLGDQLRGFVTGFFASLTKAKRHETPIWAPNGLAACRTDGREFSVEATISPLQLEDGPGVTLIVREIEKRRQAEASIEALQGEKQYLQEEIGSEHNSREIIGNSDVLVHLLSQVERVAPVDTTVLISGETGTGKELIARAVHTYSQRSNKLLVKLNCAALPPELLESELFGHEKGAFTGALKQRKGRFELADQGTLFLDEIGELSLEAQAKLLRVLQEQEFERVGGTTTIRVNVRVVAATNRNLARLVAQGKFREDLYYRLNVVPLEVPPLRERREDIPLLAKYFVDKFARSMGKSVRGICEESLVKLMHYDWPGNIREMQNIVERAVVLAQGEWIEIHDSFGADPRSDRLADMAEFGIDFFEAGSGCRTILTEEERKNVDRANIIAALKETNGKVYGTNGAASRLGVKPTTLASRIKSLGIRKNAFEPSFSFAK